MERIKEFVAKHKTILGETVLVSFLIVAFSLFSLASLFYSSPVDVISILDKYTVNKSLILEGLIYGSVLVAASNFCFYFLHPGEQNRPEPVRLTTALIYGFLMLLGVAAFIVLAEIIFVYLKWGKGWSFFLATFLTLTYVYLMFKLYFFRRVDSKKLIWELVRFALVGVIAALFDFSTDSFMRFVVLKNLNSPTAVTVICVTCGFLVGVLVNYLCSIFMVYKSATGLKKSKTLNGIVLFVGLSAVGLFIGIGLVALFYDVLKLSYPAVFIIRTAVVLVWNYITRKLFIFK